MHSLFLLSYIVTLVRDATVAITGLIGNCSTGNRCEAVTVPPSNWFVFGIISLIK
jgi:hypothetical protein